MSASETPHPPQKIESFFAAWFNSLAALVSQFTGKPWSVAGACPAENYTPAAIFRLTVRKGLTGALWLAVSAADAALLLEAFVGEPAHLGVPLDDNQRAALSELFQQWAGLAVSEMKPLLGEIGFEVSPDPQPPAGRVAGRLLNAYHEAAKLSVRIELDKELLSNLDRRQTARMPLVPEAAPGNLDQLIREGNLDLLLDLELGVSLRFGSRRAPLREVLELSPGAVLELDREIQEPVDLLLNNRVLARGDVVVVDGNYGLHVTEIVAPEPRVRTVHD